VPGGGLVVSAWALDPDVSSSILFQLAIDGASPKTYSASSTRSDVAAQWPGYGTAHGFSTTLSLAAGAHKVCATAVNAAGTAGSSTSFGCRSVLLGSPSGAVDTIRLSTGTAVVSGWVLDPDVAKAAGWAVRVDGVLKAQGTASLVRTGFGAAHPSYGDGHGFWTKLSLSRGSHKVCVAALNVSDTRGTSRGLPCTTVTVP
jgi:hypothetical protein